MAASFASRFIPIFMRLFPILEPLTPHFASFLLKRQLKQWKNSGLIENYETKTKRLGKLHYKMDIDLALTQEQAKKNIDDLVARITRIIRR